jgi:hypothetical protein
MGTRFLNSRASPKNLYQLLQSRFGHSPPPPVSQFLRSLHSVSRDFHKSHPRNSREFVSAPIYNLDEAGASALSPDNRVPATVVTGFLGSGKVRFVSLSMERISSRFSFLYAMFGCAISVAKQGISVLRIEFENLYLREKKFKNSELELKMIVFLWYSLLLKMI